MSWTKTGDDYFDQMAARGVSRDAQLMDLECLVFCNRILSNGVLKQSALRKATTADSPQSLADELVGAGVWTATDDGWQLDWSEQRTREAVLADRERETARKQKSRDRQKRHAAGDHGMCFDTAPCRRVPGGTTAGTAPGKGVGVTTSRPDPSRREKGRGHGAAPAATPCPRCDDARDVLVGDTFVPCPVCRGEAA
jgi:hypothetical protein